MLLLELHLKLLPLLKQTFDIALKGREMIVVFEFGHSNNFVKCKLLTLTEQLVVTFMLMKGQ